MYVCAEEDLESEKLKLLNLQTSFPLNAFYWWESFVLNGYFVTNSGITYLLPCSYLSLITKVIYCYLWMNGLTIWFYQDWILFEDHVCIIIFSFVLFSISLINNASFKWEQNFHFTILYVTMFGWAFKKFKFQIGI